MKRILVTGASGFVGRGLCAALQARQLDFLAVARSNPGHNAPTFIVEDMHAATDWQPALAGVGCVIHLAARVHVMAERASKPLDAFRAVNCGATLNLARQAARNGVRRFVFVSSVKVNGESTGEKPFTAFDVAAPSDAYAVSKLEAEQGLQALSKETGLEVVIVRPPLVYGPGVRANFLKLMQLVKLGLPLPFASVRNRRSLVALDNLVDLLIACSAHPAAAGQTFLVSDDDDVDMAKLLRLLAAGMDKRARLFPLPAQALAGLAALAGKSALAGRLLDSLQVDISHTTATLDWLPVVKPEDAMRATVAHFLSQR